MTISSNQPLEASHMLVMGFLLATVILDIGIRKDVLPLLLVLLFNDYFVKLSDQILIRASYSPCLYIPSIGQFTPNSEMINIFGRMHPSHFQHPWQSQRDGIQTVRVGMGSIKYTSIR